MKNSFDIWNQCSKLVEAKERYETTVNNSDLNNTIVYEVTNNILQEIENLSKQYIDYVDRILQHSEKE